MSLNSGQKRSRVICYECVSVSTFKVEAKKHGTARQCDDCGETREAILYDEAIDILPKPAVCFKCIRFQDLAAKVEDQGVEKLCSYCATLRQALALDALMDGPTFLPVCHVCIADAPLAEEVREEGGLVVCRYCGKTREGLSVDTLVDLPSVCHACVRDQVLSDEVKAEGALRRCSYCGKTREAIPRLSLGKRIHEALGQHFKLTPDYPVEPDEFYEVSQGTWERRGEPVLWLVSDIAGICKKIAGDVIKELSESHGYDAVKGGDENPYGYEACYEERDPDPSGFWATWTSFESEISSRARFFNSSAEAVLRDIFGDLSLYTTVDGRPVVTEYGPDAEELTVWRARIAESYQCLEEILVSADRQLGPPPSSYATAGRMNAQGISVFYGAMDEDTCVAEVRAPVGSRVALGKFSLLRRVKLLDLSALAKVYEQGSCFDGEYSLRKSRARFLKDLVAKMTKAVMPREEESEYLATQVVADFLANKTSPAIDGIIYDSAQTGGVGRNLVLFNQASVVALSDLLAVRGLWIPKFEGRDAVDESDYEDPDIILWEDLPDGQPSPDSRAEEDYVATMDSRLSVQPEKSDSPSEPTLELDQSSIFVFDVKAVKYEHIKRRVNRYTDPRLETEQISRDWDSILEFDG